MIKRWGESNASSPLQSPAGWRTASPFVGRDDEMRRLGATLTRAANGEGGAIFLTGQPGIGKTRLAREALALAKTRGFTTLEGRAHPLESGLAYAPILEAFGHLLRNLDSAHLECLVTGLPELGLLFGGLSVLPPEPLGDPALEKTRFFEAVSRFLNRVTQKMPIILFVDDLQWIDSASLELLYYLARGLADQRALLIATYGSDALDTADGLSTFVESLQRDGLAEEIVIGRLWPDAVERLVRAALGGEAPVSLLALLDRRACGTPLFIEALLTALIDSGNLARSPTQRDGWVLDAERATSLPPSVRRLILGRLKRLPAADRHVLDLMAIMGNATSHAILRIASGLGDEALIEAMQRLQKAGLVAERVDGSDVIYGIAHPLIQEVAYAELPEMARRRAHLAAIKAIESLLEGRPDDPSVFPSEWPGQALSQLARQYSAAGPEANRDRALAVLLAAGERAYAVYANEEAARHYEDALGIASDGRCAGQIADAFMESEPLLPRLLERLGEVWDRLGKGSAAAKAWHQALVEHERTGDVVPASRLHRRLALAECDFGHFDLAQAHLEAGMVALSGRGPCQELADLYFARYHIAYRRGDMRGVADSAGELLSLTKQLASPRVEAEAELAASTWSLWQNDMIDARERATRALRLGERAGELVVCCRAHTPLVLIGLRTGDHEFMRYHAQQGLDAAERLGAPHLWTFFLRIYLAFSNFLSGDWDESLRRSSEAIALARRLGDPSALKFSLACQAMILAIKADFPEAEACICELRTGFGDGGASDRAIFGLIEIAEATFALERGRAEEALPVAQSLIDRSELAALPAGLTSPYMPMGLMLLAEAQVAVGNPENALETVGKLNSLGPSGAPYVTALAFRAEGLARQALGQREQAVHCAARAHETFIMLGMPFEAARALLEQAKAGGQGSGVRGHDPDEPLPTPIQAARQSLAIFERLGARRYADRARRLLRELGTSPSPPRRASKNQGPLSERELEVARLVANGLTSAEIADRLFLSPRTVTAHLEHMYARLGIGSRAALAKYVIEAGLIPPPENR